MKKKKLLLTVLLLFVIFAYKNVHAFDASSYRYRNLCDTYEVAGFHADGYIDQVSCFSKYEDAQEFMRNNGAVDLAIMTKVNGQTKIVDANIGFVDLTVNPNQLTYFYAHPEHTYSYTYMDNGSSYGAVDGALMGTGYSNAHGWVAQVRIGSFTGWIEASTYEIVPITWIKSLSYYEITNDHIKHIYVSKIQNPYSSTAGSTIGPKPEMMNPGNYYSFDGHYFYEHAEDMVKDYKAGNYNHAANKDNPYYNYYMYLSNHTKTSYSSINIDEYIRNNLGYYMGVYGDEAESGTSKLYGMGTFFYYAQEKYGVNAILSLSLSRNETANGRSYLAVNKNNGFGLDAVDSNPINGARWYPTFASSILGYASKWVTYGFAHPRDWRYFGPQFGEKQSGMNVKYASDAYWSEKMASNYYYLDKSLGLQDYNYYQLGVLTEAAHAYKEPTCAAKVIYTYPEKEDALVIVDELTSNGEKWYKVVSDLNIDSNGNEITSGDYNWNSYVYVRAFQVKKINNGKNGYISPNSVFEYQNKNYTYDLHIENNELKPQVAISVKRTNYYYDSTLTSKTGQELLQDRHLMVYATAYDNNMPVAYLVTSNYNYDQKHWVSADTLRFTNCTYGKVTVSSNDNQSTKVNSTDNQNSSVISGLYTNTYVPILEVKESNGNKWYKVPVNLSQDYNIYGYTLANTSNTTIALANSVYTNAKPVINASDKELEENATFDPKKDVTASDSEDGDLTSSIEITENTVNTKVAGEYKVTYKVTDSANQSVTKTIKVVVKLNNPPVITANDKTLTVGDTFNPKDNVTANDQEDGDLTNSIEVIENTVNTSTKGTYKVVYKVTDSKGKSTTKEISVVVKEEILETTTLEGIDLSSLNITGNNFTQKESIFYFDYLKEVNNKLEIKGYNVIRGIDNTLNKDIKYVLKFESLNDDNVYAQVLNRITDKNEINRPVNSQDSNDYTYSWFKGNIEFNNIPDGDYKLYIISISEDKYSTSLISNKVLKTQASSYQGDKYVTTRNNYYDNSIPLELIVRSEKIGNKTAKSTYNLYNQYRVLEFTDNNLHIKGTSYSYGMDLGKNTSVERKIIFENTNSYQKYTYDLGSTDQGLYQAGTNLGDNQPKDKAWFDANIDLSNLPKGEYAIYISTTSNVSDYGEFTEALGRDVSKITKVINNKTYKFKLVKDKRYRLELIVE